MSLHPPARQAPSRHTHPPACVVGSTMPRPRATGHDDADPPTWGWALVEIRTDGTWGEPRVIPAPGAVEPPLAAVRPTAPSSITELSELLKTHLAAARIENAGRGEVAAVLSR
jgi:hypothetical protein